MSRVEGPLFRWTPETVSEGWAEYFEALPDPNQTPMAPEADDLEGWDARRAEFNAPLEEMANDVVEAFSVAVEATEIGGVSVLQVTPQSWSDDGRRLVYTHGGAFTLLSSKAMLTSAAMNAHACGIRVLSIDFTPAPQAKWDEITDQVVSVVRALQEAGHDMCRIACYGDSAGGGLMAGSILKMRDAGLDLPAALFLWSPWADITESGDSYQTLRAAEPSYLYERLLGPAAAAYADAANQKHPYVSPVYGDFTKGFPPTLIQGGLREIFLSNFVRLYRAIDSAGQSVVLDLYEGMPHVFQVGRPDSTETRTALQKVAKFLTGHLAA